jgi:predicted secreted protein
MTQLALLGKGALLKMAATDGTTFATIAELRSVPFPQLVGSRLDVTTHDTSGFVRQYVAGLDDLPAIRFQINWLPANATHDETTGLLSVQRDKSIRNWKLQLPAAVTPTKVFSFQAQITTFNPTVPIDNVMQVEIELQPNAAPTIGST